ncbi:MAG: alpha-L-fucosidase, partial [Algibacter sp.]
MKKFKKRSIYVCITLLFGLNSCKKTPETLQISESVKESFDQTSKWILLNKTEAVKGGNSYSWDFEVKHPVIYNVQVIFTKDISEDLEKVKLNVNEQEIEESFKGSSYRTYKNQLVSEFKKTIKFSKTGKHILTIETAADFEQIRIVPNFRNPIGAGNHHEEWLKMNQSPEKRAALDWFKEAKFGMFIHWGLYSQAGGVWKGTRINAAPYPGPKVAEWLMHAFRIPRDEYVTLAKTFNPDKSFAQNIAKLAKDAGMKYVVITSKHHDGFALFDSKSS